MNLEKITSIPKNSVELAILCVRRQKEVVPRDHFIFGDPMGEIPEVRKVFEM